MNEWRNRPGAEQRGLSRRTFLKLSAGAALAGAFGPLRLKAAGEPMSQRAIPASGERIPVIGLGTARTFDVPLETVSAMEPLRGVLSNFFNAGGRLVDSSPMYGNAETVVGRLAAELGIAEALFMATKVWTRGREAGITQMRRSRERMGGDRLELIQVHNLMDLKTQLETLKSWREEGRVRYIGITHSRTSHHDDLARIVEREPIDFVQLNYNIAARNAEQRLLPVAADKGVATLINEPFETGSLFRRVRGAELPAWAGELDIASWAQFFLKFIVGHPAVTCAIPATSNPQHAADNAVAGHGRLPEAKERERMIRYFNAL